ncbi:MAG: hypothetical protein JO322_04710 [Candidatus Eremiobacteraeota bacterium]|nr:hypothetical protein [Candidatus Eremiobacteraeota bacterium]
MRLLFVSNGYGEIAIADRIAEEVKRLVPDAQIDHVALVGNSRARFMNEVGPRRVMPSGGLIAMGNVANIVRDVRGGLLGLTLAQRRFLKSARNRYDGVVAVGDVFALLMTLAAHTPTTYVGTAKSVLVAPYGAMERRAIKRASNVFVRDTATAEHLRRNGVHAVAPGNVIVDLFEVEDDPRADEAVAGYDPAIAVFPGSRDSAYEDGEFLMRVIARCAHERPLLGAVFSVAPMLDPKRFAAVARDAGLGVRERDDERIPFEALLGERVVLRAWRGEIGVLLRRVTLVVGQAGTANEAAAAAGVPVMAFELTADRKTHWYRMRQHGLLGEALTVLPADVGVASNGVLDLLDNESRRARMGAVGRNRMGPPGGAAAIARAIVGTLA